MESSNAHAVIKEDKVATTMVWEAEKFEIKMFKHFSEAIFFFGVLAMELFVM